jgi:tetratricopeptide (TPR) repeat protein
VTAAIRLLSAANPDRISLPHPREERMPTHVSDVPQPPPADEVDVLATQLLAQLRSGANPDRQALVRAYPHLAPRLERRLAHVEMCYRLGLAPEEDGPTSFDLSIEASGLAPDVTVDRVAASAPVITEAGAGSQPHSPPGYEILAEIGHGGMGVVYRARQQSLNRVVALKMIAAGVHARADIRARFHVEAEALASLQHPNIVPIYEIGEHDGCPFMAMEFLDGGTLADYLEGRPQPPRAAAELVETLARAMHAAHQRGIVHRDLKPANVLLSFSREPPASAGPALAGGSRLNECVPKITDFGLAKRLAEDKGQTTAGSIMGTPSYMAPEQATGRSHEIGPATDVYSLGTILYEMLTGQPPFREETAMATLRRVVAEEPAAPSRLCPKLPCDLETICLKCLEKTAVTRYGIAAELADDLRRFLDGKPIAARPAGVAERVWKWVKRRPAWAALIGVSVAAALALAVVGFWWSVQVRAERDRAQSSLHTARKAIDDLYSKMASERLFDEPQLEPLCQELLEKAQTLYEQLGRENSADPEVRRDIALAWFRLGDIHHLRDEHDEAEQAYGEAIARQEALRRDYPQEPRYRQDLANSHNWLGEVLRERNAPKDAAERHYRAALKLQQELVEQFRDQPAYRMELARSHYNLGVVAKDRNRLPEARRSYDRAVALLTDLKRTNAEDPNVRQDLARALINRGVLHRLDGRPGDAARDYGRAIALLARLRNDFPGRAAFRLELAIARQDLGNLFWSQARPSAAPGERRQTLADARREHQEALALLRQLVADYSGRPRYQKKLGNTLKNLGSVLAMSGDKPGAEKQWEKARVIFEGLVKSKPDVADYHGLLGMTLGNLGWRRTDQKNWRLARDLFERGIAQVQAALAANPDHPDYRQELRNQYQNLGWTLVKLGDHEAAERAATGLAEVFPERAQDTYYAACLVARCVPLARSNVEQAQAYMEKAVALLRRATRTAPPGLERIDDEEQVFQVLASQPDFAEVMRNLETKMQAPKKSR